MEWNRLPASQVIKYLSIALVIIALVTLNHIGWLNMNQLLVEVRENSASAWLILALILAQIILYTFALGGSYALWLVAPVYAPLSATMILAIGGTLGAISAYYFSRKISDKWTRRIERSRVYQLLHEHHEFFMIFSLRVLPGFPHGLINYSAGILKCRPAHFLAASFAGFVIKFYIYSALVYKAADVITNKTSFDILSLSPLILLSVLSLIAMYILRRVSGKPA